MQSTLKNNSEQNETIGYRDPKGTVKQEGQNI
jgi:chromosome segregation ATPase